MSNFRKMQLQKEAAEQRKLNIKRRKRRERLREMDDWFASDYSCCLCVPIEHSINIMGWVTIINAALLIKQINNVTDDGSSKRQVAGPSFYYTSYLCWSPMIYGIYSFVRFWLKDSEHTRSLLVQGNTAVFFSIIALYCWFFVYFISIEETDFQTKDTILLIILLFASP